MTIIEEHSPLHKPVSAPPAPDLLTVAEVARVLRWQEMTIRRHIASGLIPPWAVVSLPHRGKRTSYRIKRAWLERVLNNSKTTADKAEESASSVSF